MKTALQPLWDKFTETPAYRTHPPSLTSAVLNLEFVEDDHPPHPRTLPLWEKGLSYICIP